ncbi:hypothetical protein ACFVSS_09205 [Peribacillus butanolivorans]|uniref:hypothetical protein n=1 Tax=Peribacillus butanolivorans TaxID=421767 RepID=UPI0036DA63C9
MGSGDSFQKGGVAGDFYNGRFDAYDLIRLFNRRSNRGYIKKVTPSIPSGQMYVGKGLLS